MDFTSLVEAIRETHAHFAVQAVRAVNVNLTLRNWVIGHHIAEFELQGADRAAYGDRLLGDLSEALQCLKISNTGRRQLYQYLAFYRAYPQIVPSVPAQLRGLLPAASRHDEKVRAPTAQSSIEAETLVRQLSYSHFELLVSLEKESQRTFYERECVRGQWSVRELRRQISSLYYERSHLSTDPARLAALAQSGAETDTPALAGMDNHLFVSRYQLELPQKEELERFLQAEMEAQGLGEENA